jgi:hypothetical protein
MTNCDDVLARAVAENRAKKALAHADDIKRLKAWADKVGVQPAYDEETGTANLCGVTLTPIGEGVFPVAACSGHFNVPWICSANHYMSPSMYENFTTLGSLEPYIRAAKDCREYRSQPVEKVGFFKRWFK